jgi:hypothetical protein
METIDEEIFAAADKFIDRSAREKKPFFVWFNTTRMHVWTHLKKASDGKTGIGLYSDGMAGAVGRALHRHVVLHQGPGSKSQSRLREVMLACSC